MEKFFKINLMLGIPVILFGCAGVHHKKFAHQKPRPHVVSKQLPVLNQKIIHQETVSSAQLFEKDANQGDANAQYNLGMMFKDGLNGVPKDYVKAAEWFEKSAIQGNIPIAV